MTSQRPPARRTDDELGAGREPEIRAGRRLQNRIKSDDGGGQEFWGALRGAAKRGRLRRTRGGVGGFGVRSLLSVHCGLGGLFL